MRTLLLITLTLLTAFVPIAGAQTTLNPGDIAFLGYRTIGADGFVFAPLEPLATGTEIKFTDQGWTGTQFVSSSSETLVTWTATNPVAAGTPIQIVGDSATVGALTGNFNVWNNHDQLYAFQGTIAAPAFVAAFNTGTWYVSGGLNYDYEGYLPTELVGNRYSLAFGGSRLNAGYYDGPLTAASKEDLRTELHLAVNWKRDNSDNWPTSFPTFTLDSTAAQPGTILTPGDLIPLAFQSDAPDQFAFQLLTAVDAGTQIQITDHGWDGTRFVENSYERRITWTADLALPAETVVTISGSTTSVGILTGVWDRMADNDQLYFYQGKTSEPEFLYAWSLDTWYISGSVNYDYEGARPASLTPELHTLRHYGGRDNGYYSGTYTQGPLDSVLREISSPINWERSDNINWPNPLPTVSVGPEVTEGTQLDPGDIAFLGYHTDAPERLAFLLLKAVSVGTRIQLTDHGWNGTRFEDLNGDQLFSWEATSALPAGTVISIEGSTTNVGTLNGSLRLLDGHDQMYAFQGKATNPRFVAALNSSYWRYNPPINYVYEGVRPIVLENDQKAIAFNLERDNGYYLGLVTEGTPSQL
ncbi:MAG TPA: hypothetical protein DCP28_38335, partial [Cytophagales bacterium]|nr:hypothetical protein [Cytophagales bacterium]